MMFSGALALISLVAAAVATTEPVTFDPGYDNASRSLNDVACSNGANGLITHYGWQTQGAVTGFPYIGGVAGVSWNSPQCGTCWSVTYNGKTVYIRAIDHVSEGINMSEEAMNALTGGEALALGRVDADVEQVDASCCGVPS